MDILSSLIAYFSGRIELIVGMILGGIIVTLLLRGSKYVAENFSLKYGISLAIFTAAVLVYVSGMDPTHILSIILVGLSIITFMWNRGEKPTSSP